MDGYTDTAKYEISKIGESWNKLNKNGKGFIQIELISGYWPDAYIYVVLLIHNPHMTSNEAIIEYYDRCEVHYKMHWNLQESLSLHYGYWDDSTDSFHEALLNINEKLIEYADIKASHKILDMGCGIGGSSIYLAREVGCDCTGITLSEKQVATANQLSEKQGLSSHCRFEARDYTQTGYPDASFDIIWAIESVCHANDKRDFIKEAYRLLRSGGKLVMADFLQKRPDLAPDDQFIMDQWAAGWAIPFYETADNFKRYTEDAGFELTFYEDASQHVLPSAKRLYYRFFPGWIGAKLYRLFNPGSSAISMANVWTAYYQYKGLKKNLWEYGILVAKK